MKTVKPEITRYLSIKLYLADLYSWQKEQDPQFSYNIWAQNLGFNNKSLLRLIVQGHRSITETSRKLLVDGLQLDNFEKTFFTTLALLDSAKNEIERKKLNEEVSQLLRTKYNQIQIDDPQFFLSSPKIPALQTLISFEDVRSTVNYLALLLNESSYQVEDWLMKLERMELASKSEDGTWKATHKSFKVPGQPGNKAIYEYHAKCLEHAIEARTLPPETRRYRALLFALGEEDFQTFSKLMDDFALQLLNSFDRPTLFQKRLYQFNTALTPISMTHTNQEL